MRCEAIAANKAMQTQIQLAQSQAEEANESKDLAAREFELTRQRWRVEIEQKTKDFDELQKRRVENSDSLVWRILSLSTLAILPLDLRGGMLW